MDHRWRIVMEKQLQLWATREWLSEHLSKQRLKTHLQPEDIADGRLFFASSNASRMIIGQTKHR